LIMEDRLWDIVCVVLPECKASSRQTYSDREVLLVVLWAVLHDRPMSWACEPEHWSTRRRLRNLPHASTISRRVRKPGLASLLEAAHVRSRELLKTSSGQAMIDGKPLLVSDYSRDPDARNGRAMRRFGRGYKLHAVIDAAGVVLAFSVLSLNVQERKAAGKLLPAVSNSVRRVFADGNYDSGPLQRQLESTGLKLYTPLINNYAGPRSHPRRRRLARIMNHEIGDRIANAREHIERQFGLLGNLGFGLKGLPNWVRRHGRVARWVSCKLLLFHAWKLSKQTAA
jgi:Transposase DDE domain